MMLDGPALTIDCPACQQPLGLRKNLVRSAVQCKKCGVRVQVGDDGRATEVSESSEAVIPPVSVASTEAPLELLEWLEDLFIKMIRGIFKFTLVHVPRELYRALVRWFPTLVRTLRVVVLGMIWLVLASAPFNWMLFHEAIVNRLGWDGSVEPVWYHSHRLAWNASIYLYSLLAVAGSGWGVLYIKRLRRKMADKKAPDKRSSNGHSSPNEAKPLNPARVTRRPQ